MTTIGSGNYTYELISDWARLPEGQEFGMVSALASDSQDRVYIFQRKDPAIVIFDRDGNYVDSWGNGEFENPHGISITDDAIYVTDREQSVASKYSLDGKLLLKLGTPGVHSDTGCEVPQELVPRAAGPFNFPTEMVVAPSGDIYVSDGYRNARVHRFAADGTLKASWGQGGKGGPNEFHLPHSIIVGQDERVYLCDRENSRIQVFDEDGKYLATWTDMQRPNDITQDKDGVFYTCERENPELGQEAQVSVLDTDGNVLARWNCRSAHGNWVDSNGDLYLACGMSKTVDKYVRK